MILAARSNLPATMERVWASRLRWRMRGAWLWPAFAGSTALGGVVIHTRPVSGQGTGLIAALLLAGFVNLAAVAVVAPLGARLLRRRRADLPRIVAFDYAGTALLAVVLAGFVAAGLVHHPDVMRERHATAYATRLARDYVARRGPSGYRSGVARADTYRVDPGRVYRTCVPGPNPERPFCVVVHLDTSPPRLVLDGHEPNTSRWPRGA